MAENPRIEELRRRVQSDPASIAFAALAEEYRRTGRNEEAIEICRTGLQRHPAYLSARVTLGRALIEVGDFEGARTELQTVLDSAPENLAAIRGLAQIHERLGHSAEMHPDLAALAAQPLPVKPAAPEPDMKASPESDLKGPAYNGPASPEPDSSGPAYNHAVEPLPLKIDLPDTAGGHTALEIDLPSPSAVHQNLDIDLPLEGGARDGFKLDLPAALDVSDTAMDTVTAADAQTDTDAAETDAALERLQQLLVAVQNARESLGDGGTLRH